MNVNISVIIPTYGRPAFLKRAIKSCINQSHKEIEVLVVDDNDPNSSTRKETEELMRSYSDNRRIKYIRHPKNKGGAAARNTGIGRSKGKYISFLDDDDEYLEERQEKCFKYCENNKTNSVITNYCLNKKKSNIYSEIKEEHLNLYSLLSKKLNIGTGSNLFFKRETLLELGGFDEEFQRHQDIEVLVRYLKGNTLGLVKENLVIKHQEDKMNYPSPKKLAKVKKVYLNKFKKEINLFPLEEKQFILDVHNKEVIREYFKNIEFKKGLELSREISNGENKITMIEVFHWSLIGFVKKILKYLI